MEKYSSDEEALMRIRYLHFQIKHLEENLEKNEEEIDLDDLNYVLEYTRILNINYGMDNHQQILKELDITPNFHDPEETIDIEIQDIMYECARVIWVLARAYNLISERYEEREEFENAIISMLECSKMYKAAAYFSAASIHQKKIGKTLTPINLELNSEETRIIAQSIAASKEEKQNNLYFASKLYAGLSALSKRLLYLKNHEEKKKQQIRAQFHYDMGKSCFLKAEASSNSSITTINHDRVLRIKQKANFYYEKARSIWKMMLETLKDISSEEREIVQDNLSIVEDDISQNQVESLEYEDIKKIQDPEPIIIIPENLAPFVPKSTVYLTQFVPKDVNKWRWNKWGHQKKLEKKIPYSKKEKLLDKKAGMLRAINELKTLKQNNEIDITKFAELMETYSTKIKMVDRALEKLAKR